MATTTDTHTTMRSTLTPTKAFTVMSALAACNLLLAQSTWAHGTQEHPNRMPMVEHTMVTKEQKPWGIGAARAEARRTIEVRMTDDMRFTPQHIQVREGETVRIVASNRGKMLHEIVLGTPEELLAHAELMKKHPGMEHDEPYMSHVGASQRGEIIWNFNRPGEFEFACLIPGHLEAGMKGTITVLPVANQTNQR
jgi:uncharacterized cupredoxin-like copper-binding protein